MVIQKMETPPFDLQAYEPPVSLWKLIEHYSPNHEKEEIRNMLGESLVDQSLELHEEINILLEIWRDYREQTTHCSQTPRLPEPPGVRDRLVQEIQFFVTSVKEKAKHEGVNAEKFLSRHKPDVIDYALDTYRADSVRSPSRPGTARGMDGRETPMITSPTGSDRISAASTLSEEVESMNDKLTVLKFDEVVSHLRNTLEEEIETLMKDIYFLQNCLDDEATFRAESTGTLTREPTLTDLKEERTLLEKDLLTNMKSQSSPPLKHNFNNPATNLKPLGPSLSQTSKVKTMSSHTHESSPLHNKTGPMKAFTSPESTTGGTSRTGSGRRKMEATETAQTGYPKHQNMNKTPSMGDSGNVARVKYGHTHSRAHGRNLNEDRHHRPSDSNSEKSSSHHSSRKASLEAVVTLSKGGDSSSVSEIQVVPSPPSSAKPTTPRPSSAQRFRKMVLDCRD